MQASSVRLPLLRLGLLVILVVLLGTGCNKRSWHRIPNGKLQKILTELYTARGVGQTLYITSEEQDSLYASILQAHKVTQEDLDSTIYYLSASKARVLQKIIAQSTASIQREVEILERTAGFFNISTEDGAEYFFSPLSDSLSYSVTTLSPYPIRINKEQHGYLWQVALSDIPNHPDTIRQVEIQGLIKDTYLPSQYQMPSITISKQLYITPPPFDSESATIQLPFTGHFSLSIGETYEEQTTETDSLTTTKQTNLSSFFLASDTISISLYALPTSTLNKQSLRFKLQDLRIIAR